MTMTMMMMMMMMMICVLLIYNIINYLILFAASLTLILFLGSFSHKSQTTTTKAL